MTQYINKAAVVAEIKRRMKLRHDSYKTYHALSDFIAWEELEYFKEEFLPTLEVKEVDLDKLGEIARHLIAAKEHIEDMRLDKEEWLILEKIGYPERFKAQKGE